SPALGRRRAADPASRELTAQTHPRPADEVCRARHDHARDQQPADDDVLVLRGDEVERQRSLQAAEDADGEQDADDRAAAAEDRDAAEEDDRDDEQLLADARVVARGGEAKRPEDAGKGAEETREDEQPEL